TPGHSVADDPAVPVPCALAGGQRVAAPARARVVEERARLLETEADRGEDAVDGIRPAVVSVVHAVSPGGAACGALPSPRGPRPGPRRRRRRRPRPRPPPPAPRP